VKDDGINTMWDHTPEGGWEQIGTFDPDTEPEPEPTGREQKPETD
jgi:hypothetical protein